MTIKTQLRGCTIAAMVMCAAAPAALAPAPAYALTSIVYDPTAVAQMVKQVAQMKAQLDTLTKTYTTVTQQLSQAQKAYEAVTGARGMGDIFNNPALRKYMPADVKAVYDATQQGGLKGITGTVCQTARKTAPRSACKTDPSGAGV